MAGQWVIVAVPVVLILVGLVVVGALLRRRFAVVTVDGLSMQPTLNHGDRLLVRRLPAKRVRAGQIVLLQRPDPVSGWDGMSRSSSRRLDSTAWYVKRAVAVPGDAVTPELVARCTPQRAEQIVQLGQRVPDGRYLLFGDNPRSDDSKQWGYCPGALVHGVMVRRMSGTGAAAIPESIPDLTPRPAPTRSFEDIKTE